MKLVNQIREFITESDFTIHIFHGKVNLVNYTSIGHFDSNKIIVRHEKGEVVVKGDNLVVSKLMNDEILITGTIKEIEFR